MWGKYQKKAHVTVTFHSHFFRHTVSILTIKKMMLFCHFILFFPIYHNYAIVFEMAFQALCNGEREIPFVIDLEDLSFQLSAARFTKRFCEDLMNSNIPQIINSFKSYFTNNIQKIRSANLLKKKSRDVMFLLDSWILKKMLINIVFEK